MPSFEAAAELQLGGRTDVGRQGANNMEAVEFPGRGRACGNGRRAVACRARALSVL